MHRALPSRWLRSTLSIVDRAALHEIPLFLCPAAGRSFSVWSRKVQISGVPYGRCMHVGVASSTSSPPPVSESPPQRRLPSQCTGCGAFTQTNDPNTAGYYDLTRKVVREYLGEETKPVLVPRDSEQDLIVQKALEGLGSEQLEKLGLAPQTFIRGKDVETGDDAPAPPGPKSPPLCDRCHKLVHHHQGTPIYHPSVDSLRDTIQESPYKYNHIYHVVDAADFPMSLVPRLHQLLGDVTLRSRNRRSRAGRFYKDRKMDMSFIITRSDLLAPQKEQVDKLLPWMREVLRETLGKVGKMVRLGNVRCVSAKRSWWTKTLKEEIWERGGAGWMVGKVNVGKSQLFEAVYPKGRMEQPKGKNDVGVDVFPREHPAAAVESIPEVAVAEAHAEMTAETEEANWENSAEGEHIEDFSMLPPPRPETNYPEMPTVSALPGTTASPIRIPYGNGKGELIDLPGLARSDLELFVKPEHRASLVMQNRIVPVQQSITPGKSLILGGGLIRITPRTPDLVFLGYNFTPLKEHLTSTQKAIEFQEQTRADHIGNIALPEAAQAMRHAGSFQLRYDLTKERAGPITRRDAINIKVENLPYRVLAIDILIEGCGWVEIVAQVRTRHLYGQRGSIPRSKETSVEEEKEVLLDDFERAFGNRYVDEGPKEQEPNWPVVDVYSPEGRFIGSRRPMNSWMLNKRRVLAKHKRARPRKSMKGAKKRAKMLRRAAEGATAAAT